MTASFADLWSAVYAQRIQDALGNTGATVTLNDTNPGSLAISGTATGLGLTILAKQQAATDAPQGNIDAVTLSPNDAGKSSASCRRPPSLRRKAPSRPPRTPSRQKTRAGNPVERTSTRSSPSTTNATGGQTIDPTDVTALATENPSQVIKDAVSAAQAAMTDTASFHAAAASDSKYRSIHHIGLVGFQQIVVHGRLCQSDT